jgi:hypothetical protein
LAAPGPVSITVTRDYGSSRVDATTVTHLPAGSSALEALQRRFKVALGSGRQVRAIDGVTAGPGEHWRLFVNGVAAGVRTEVHVGDRLWWDLDGRPDVSPAVVGSFPEPFVRGLAGRRLPTTVECAGDVAAACSHVGAVLGDDGVPTASQLLGTGSGQDSLNVVVGTWRDIHQELAATVLAQGPAHSGVFARFVGGSKPVLQLLGRSGQTARTVGPNAGLVAALQQAGAPPTWLVLGTDAAGVRAAAHAFSAAGLRDHFALAVSGGRDFALPQ